MGAGFEARPSWSKVMLLAIRPATLWVSVVPVVVGAALAFAHDVAQWDIVFCALLSALFLQIGANLVNDYADFKKGADTAQRLGPVRVTQRGWVSPGMVRGGALISFLVAIAFGSVVCWHAGWPMVWVGLVSIAAGVAYTAGPYPLGYHGLGDLFVFMFFGVVAVCGTYYVQARAVTGSVVWASVAVGALATAILVVNNLRDRHTDGPAGKRTLAVRYGGEFARRQYVALLGLAYGALVLACLTTEAGVGWLLPCLTLPLAVGSVRRVMRLDGAALNPLLGQTARLELVFGGLLAVGVLL